jgi:hypothetical protein
MRYDIDAVMAVAAKVMHLRGQLAAEEAAFDALLRQSAPKAKKPSRKLKAPAVKARAPRGQRLASVAKRLNDGQSVEEIAVAEGISFDCARQTAKRARKNGLAPKGDQTR